MTVLLSWILESTAWRGVEWRLHCNGQTTTAAVSGTLCGSRVMAHRERSRASRKSCFTIVGVAVAMKIRVALS